jgi:hypothetical protein
MKISQQQKATGETMIKPPIQDAGRPDAGRQQTMQDVILVSSFGLWAVVLGLAPALAFRLMTAS